MPARDQTAVNGIATAALIACVALLMPRALGSEVTNKCVDSKSLEIRLSNVISNSLYALGEGYESATGVSLSNEIQKKAYRNDKEIFDGIKEAMIKSCPIGSEIREALPIFSAAGLACIRNDQPDSRQRFVQCSYRKTVTLSRDFVNEMAELINARGREGHGPFPVTIAIRIIATLNSERIDEYHVHAHPP